VEEGSWAFVCSSEVLKAACRSGWDGAEGFMAMKGVVNFPKEASENLAFRLWAKLMRTIRP
jgi:hypothetical protein